MHTAHTAHLCHILQPCSYAARSPSLRWPSPATKTWRPCLALQKQSTWRDAGAVVGGGGAFPKRFPWGEETGKIIWKWWVFHIYVSL